MGNAGSLKRRLLLSYLLLAAIVLLVLEVPLGIQSAHRDRAQLAGRAQGDAQALAVLVAEDLEHPAGHDLGRLVGNYRLQSSGAEVAVVNGHGSYIVRLDPAEGDHDAADLRPGIRGALGGASVISSFRDEGRPVLSASVPVGMDRPSEGAVILSLPADATDDQIEATWAELAIGAVVILGVTALVGFRSGAFGHCTVGPSRGGCRSFWTWASLHARVARGTGGDTCSWVRSSIRWPSVLKSSIADQGRFVADASHQLRSPLTALRLRLENLEAHGGDDRDSADLVAAESEVLRLSRLVDGLLTLHSAESQSRERQTVDVGDVVDERCSAWSPLVVEGQVDLAFDRCADHQMVAAVLVPGDLEQILDNLVANAVDATPPGGAISVGVIAERTTVTVHVIDDGPGMSENERVHAFDRFWQGSERKRGRSGLGLAIVRQLVIRNGGTVVLRRGATAAASRPSSVSPRCTRIRRRAGCGPARTGGS